MKIVCFVLSASCIWFCFHIDGFSQIQPGAGGTIGDLFDPDVRRGKLANGFSYFLLRKPTNAGKASFSFIVKAGSSNEGSNQQSSAHWIEHLAVRGTRNFPAGVMNFAVDLGLSKGGQINATTKPEFTQYYVVDFPTSSLSNVRRLLFHYQDMTTGVILDSLSVYSEAGAIVSEGLSLKDHEAEFQEKMVAKLLSNSEWSKPMSRPILRKVSDFNAVAMFDFYKTWYRPDREAIVVVGDFDTDILEQQIKEIFSVLKKPLEDLGHQTGVPPRTSLRRQTRVTFLAHPDQKLIEFELHFKVQEFKNIRTVLDVASNTTCDLFSHMIQSRIRSVVNASQNDFIRYLSIDFSHFAQAYQGVIVRGAVMNAEQLETALKFCFQELERVRRFCFSDSELEDAKRLVIQNFESRSDEPSWDMNRLVDHVVNESLVLDRNTHRELVSRNLKMETATTVSESARRWIESEDIDIVIKSSVPPLVYSEQAVLSWMSEVRSRKDIKDFKRSERDIKLGSMIALPEREPEYIRKHVRLDVSEYRLANGIKVFVKPVFKQKGHIELLGFAPGGTDLFVGDRKMSAKLAPEMIKASGVAGFTEQELNSFFERNSVTVTPFIAQDFSGITGACSVSSLNVLLGAVHDYFTSPNERRNSFDHWKKKRITGIQSEEAPFTMYDSINEVVGAPQADARISVEHLMELKYRDLVRVYNERFINNSSNYTFFLSGDVDDIMLSVNRYLGSIPEHRGNSGGSFLAEKSNRVITLPKKFVAETVLTSDGIKNGALVVLVAIGNYENTLEQKVLIDVFQKVLARKMTERLRDKEGGVYSVNASIVPLTDQQFKVQVDFECSVIDTLHARKLIGAATDELAKLRDGGVSEEYFRSAVHSTLVGYQGIVAGMGFVNYALNQYRNNASLMEILERIDILNGMRLRYFNTKIKSICKAEDVMRFILL